MSEVAANTIKALRDGIEHETARLNTLDASRRQIEGHIAGLEETRDGVVAELTTAQAKLSGVKEQQRLADTEAQRVLAAAKTQANEALAAANKEAGRIVGVAHAKLERMKAVLLEGDAKK